MLWLCGPSKPGVPGRVHPAQVVQAIGCSHQGVDFALSALKLSQVVEAGHDGRDGLLDQRHQLLGVHVLWLAGRGQRHGRVLLGFLVPGDDLVAEHRLQDAVDLPGTRDQGMRQELLGRETVEGDLLKHYNRPLNPITLGAIYRKGNKPMTSESHFAVTAQMRTK